MCRRDTATVRQSEGIRPLGGTHTGLRSASPWSTGPTTRLLRRSRAVPTTRGKPPAPFHLPSPERSGDSASIGWNRCEIADEVIDGARPGAVVVAPEGKRPAIEDFARLAVAQHR